jgi:hypothetical protein
VGAATVSAAETPETEGPEAETETSGARTDDPLVAVAGGDGRRESNSAADSPDTIDR